MRVLIVADSAHAAEGIRRGLRYTPICQVLGYVDARRPSGQTVADARPDVVVFDDSADPDTLLERVREIRATVPECKLVLLSRRMEADHLGRASAAGIDAAIARTAESSSVGMLVREVAAGNVFHAFVAPPASQPVRHSAADDLTARELEILRLMAGGSSNGRIAAQLWVTEQTVKFHLSNIYRKLGVANRTEASHYAHVHGLLDSPATAKTMAAAA
jgi:DNA-binding NarL/FixJ family response regulator